MDMEEAAKIYSWHLTWSRIPLDCQLGKFLKSVQEYSDVKQDYVILANPWIVSHVTTLTIADRVSNAVGHLR